MVISIRIKVINKYAWALSRLILHIFNIYHILLCLHSIYIYIYIYIYIVYYILHMEYLLFIKLVEALNYNRHICF